MKLSGYSRIMAGAAVGALLAYGGPAFADMAAAQKWVDSEFQPSTLSKEEQMKEMEWFIKAAEPFRGMEIKVVSETIPTHEYESKTLTKAFEEITGIKVTHDLIQEGDVIEKLQTQFQSGENIYDAYINDSDLIGTHSRYGFIVPLSDFMEGEGKDVTLPTLDVDDFIGKSFTTGPDGKLYQLPDQQFANLYWFRYDWFSNPEIKAKFKDKYGYDLGVPVNWSAYEDIAEFFSNDIKEVDGKAIYGHMDYGKKAPDLGWRFTDAWLGMAGVGDKGLPNGKPVDEWGIRIEGCSPVGSSVSRGGEANGPAAKYALNKYMEWLRAYAPPGALGMDFYQSLPSLAKGNVAQQIFWYTAFTASMVAPQSAGNNTVDADGKPLWRMAPSPHGPYWQEGMKLGYQDAGSWTLLNSTPLDRRKAAWLYAQFTVAKTTSLKKSHVGLTIIRDSDINDELFTERAPLLGGLVEFYRSPARVAWSPSRHQRPRLPEAGTALVAEHRRGRGRRGHRRHRHGQPCVRDGQGHGAHRARRRPGRVRPQAQSREGSERVAVQGPRAARQAREREAAGCHGRLRHADRGVAQRQGHARGREGLTASRG